MVKSGIWSAKKQVSRQRYEKNENRNLERAFRIAAPLPQVAAGEKDCRDDYAEYNRNRDHRGRSTTGTQDRFFLPQRFVPRRDDLKIDGLTLISGGFDADGNFSMVNMWAFP